MASWDFSKAAGIITTSPTPILDALAVQYGVPQCMLDMAKDVLAAFPSPVLNSIQSGIQDGKNRADEIMKDIMRRIFLDSGIVEYDTELGRFVFVSSSSRSWIHIFSSVHTSNVLLPVDISSPWISIVSCCLYAETHLHD